MAEVLATKAEQPQFPYGDISEITAVRLSLMLSNTEIFEAMHNTSESQPAMKMAHYLLRVESHRQLEGSDEVALMALSLGAGIFEGLCVMASPQFTAGLPDRIETVDDGSLPDLLAEARDEFASAMPHCADAVVEVASRRFAPQVEYALAGAALMRTLVVPDRQAA